MKLSSFYRSLLVALPLVVAVALPTSAHALTVSPVRFELGADTGQTITQPMILTNEEKVPVTFYSSFANFEAQGESGAPAFTLGNEGIRTWMHTDASVTLKPGETKVIPLSITVPKNAEAGGNFGAVFWGTLPPGGDNSGKVGVGAQLGILVLLRVNGQINEKGGILSFGISNNQTRFTALPVTFFYRFENSGSDRAKPEGAVTVRNMLGFATALVPANIVEGNVLPKSIRRFETAWQGKAGMKADTATGFFGKAHYEWNNFAFGRYTAVLALTFGENNSQHASSQKVSFWVFPWHLLVLILIVLFFVWFVGRGLLRMYAHSIERRVTAQIEERTHEGVTPKSHKKTSSAQD